MNHTLTAHGTTLVISSKGAEVQSLVREETEYLWQGDPAVWGRRAPLCFPLCGRLKDGYYVLDGKRYECTPHGFARDLEHTLVAQTEDSVTFRLEQTDQTMALYPFPFCLDTTHALTENALRTTCTVTNTGDAPMPFQIGFHFAFALPAEGTSRLTFPCPENAQVVLTPNGMVDGTEPFTPNATEVVLDDHVFDNDSICLRGLRSPAITLERADGKTLSVGIEGFPHTLLWSKPGKPHFVCIEPWYGLPDEADSDHNLFRRPEVRILAPGETFTAVHTVTL